MSKGTPPEGIDRREYIRYACKTKLKAIIDFNPEAARKTLGKVPPIVFHKGEPALAKNISKKGMALEINHYLPEGMTIKISIENPITPPIQTGGRIVWVKRVPGSKDACEIGLAFRYMREKHRRNLDELIKFLQTIPD
jgi:hypothetical protein